MAQPGGTVRVSGLPSDMEDVQLKDKLLIHYQRVSNGGGEIDSLNIIKGTPMSALITFQESRVAQRVILRGHNVLVVDGKNYQLTATEHCEHMDPNQVIVSLSATVDCRRLPGGELFLTNLLVNHRDVRLNYIEKESCTLSGSYSKVQEALTQLLEHVHERSESAKDKPNVKKASNEPRIVKTAPKTENQNRMNLKQKEEESADKDSAGGRSSGDTRPSALNPEEDCSLIIDALLFKYLQKHHSEDCQRILKMYNVRMSDQTNEGLTILTVIPLTAAGQDFLKLAKESICRFYLKHEAEIRQVQIAKSSLPSQGRLKRAMESLCTRYPKLLVSEDEDFIDMIGSDSDVSEARHFLQKFDNTEEQASLPKHTSPLVDRILPSYTPDPLLKPPWTEEEPKNPQRSKKPKLAANFNDQLALGLRSHDVVGTHSSRSGQSRPGPMLGLNVLSKVPDEQIPRALPQDISSDILFKSSPTFPSSELKDVRPKTSAPRRISQSSLTENAVLQPVGSKLRRSSSFSAIPQETVREPNSQDISSKAPVRSRARSSSFSSESNKEKHDIYKAEITVPLFLWLYMKKIYRVQVDDLTSDVLIKAKHSENPGHVTLTLSGANKDKVNLSQFGLQQLVDLLSSDFSVNELMLSDLGVSDYTDETLQACCSEMKSRYKKVCIKYTENRMFVFGPGHLCSQLCGVFRDVFPGRLYQTDEQRKITAQYNPMGNVPPSVEINRDRVLEYDANANAMFQSKTGKTQGWETTYMKDFCEKEAENGFQSLPPVNKTRAVDSTSSYLRSTASGNDPVGFRGDGVTEEHREKTDIYPGKK